MNEKMDNKQLKLTIIAVVILVVLIVGATYAYFSVGVTSNFGTSTINATAESVGSVVLQGSNANLTLNVTAVDMAKGKNDISYYASSEGKKTARTEEVVGTASVSPTTDTNYYHCSYTLRVTQSYTGDKNMYNIFKGTQAVNNSTYTASTNELILLVNGVSYDLQSNILPKEIPGEFYIKGTQTINITAGLQLNNLANKDQTLLAGSGVNLSIQVKDGTFTCTAQEEPAPAPEPTASLTSKFVVSDISMNVGSTVPQGVNLRDTEAEAMADWNSIAGEIKPFYLKQVIDSNNEIEESYVCFETDTLYCLKGKDTSAFLDNAKILYDAFQGEECYGDGNIDGYDPSYSPAPSESSFSCESPGSGLVVLASQDGTVDASFGEYRCSVDSEGNSWCGLI